jgi:acyl-CoA synthetase (AMP-forming)/AMP-acid ligase II
LTSYFEKIRTYQDSIALYPEAGKQVAYRQLCDDADSIARTIGRRCLVFLMCRNCVESVAGYVGFLRAGIVPVLLADSIDAALLNNLLEKYQPSYFFLPAEKTAEVRSESIFSYGSYVLLKLPYIQDYELNPELAVLLTTSGSTGSPKLVRQSYKNVKANTDSIINYLGISPDDRAITTLPMNYTYGLSILQTHLSRGAALILTDASLMEKRFWEDCKQYKVTTFGGVPYTYEMLKRLHFDRMDLPSLRYITQAGGKLSKELASEFTALCKQKGCKFIVMYGQTEATARMAYLPWEYAERKAGSMGVAIPGGRFWLEDENNQKIETADTTGELVYQGNNVTLGYAQNRFDLAKGDENHKILHTGDIAQRDKDGFYYIVGRKKRFLKIYGNRVNLDEIEGLLKKAGVIECACAGNDDNLKVYVTGEESKAQALKFIEEHTAINRSGFSVSVIETIPRNDAGKVLYSALN